MIRRTHHPHAIAPLHRPPNPCTRKYPPLTPTLLSAFNTQGFAVLPYRVLPPGVCASLRERYASLFRGEFDTGSYPDEWHWREGISHPTAPREICNGWKADSLIQAVVLSRTLGGIACELTGWPGSRLGQDDVL